MYAEEKFARDHVEVYTNSRVQEIKEDRILFSEKTKDGELVTKEIPYGLCLWSTGVGKSSADLQIAQWGDKSNI